MLADDTRLLGQRRITLLLITSEQHNLHPFPRALSSSVGDTAGTQVDDLWAVVAAEEH